MLLFFNQIHKISNNVICQLEVRQGETYTHTQVGTQWGRCLMSDPKRGKGVRQPYLQPPDLMSPGFSNFMTCDLGFPGRWRWRQVGGKGGNRVDSRRFGVRGSDKKAKQEEKRWVHHRAEEFRYCQIACECFTFANNINWSMSKAHSIHDSTC